MMFYSIGTLSFAASQIEYPKLFKEDLMNYFTMLKHYSFDQCSIKHFYLQLPNFPAGLVCSEWSFWLAHSTLN